MSTTIVNPKMFNSTYEISAALQKNDQLLIKWKSLQVSKPLRENDLEKYTEWTRQCTTIKSHIATLLQKLAKQADYQKKKQHEEEEKQAKRQELLVSSQVMSNNTTSATTAATSNLNTNMVAPAAAAAKAAVHTVSATRNSSTNGVIPTSTTSGMPTSMSQNPNLYSRKMGGPISSGMQQNNQGQQQGQQGQSAMMMIPPQLSQSSSSQMMPTSASAGYQKNSGVIPISSQMMPMPSSNMDMNPFSMTSGSMSNQDYNTIMSNAIPQTFNPNMFDPNMFDPNPNMYVDPNPSFMSMPFSSSFPSQQQQQPTMNTQSNIMYPQQSFNAFQYPMGNMNMTMPMMNPANMYDMGGGTGAVGGRGSNNFQSMGMYPQSMMNVNPNANNAVVNQQQQYQNFNPQMNFMNPPSLSSQPQTQQSASKSSQMNSTTTTAATGTTSNKDKNNSMYFNP